MKHVLLRRRTHRVLISLMLAVAGITHLVAPGFFLAWMPPYLPWHEALVTLSGVAELLLAVALQVPRTQIRIASGLLIALMLASYLSVHIYAITDNGVNAGTPYAIQIGRAHV